MNALKEKTKERLVIKNISKFVEKQFPSLTSKDKEKKIKEILIGFEDYEPRREKLSIVVRLPEGIKAIIDEKGNFRDFNEFFLSRR